MSRLPLVTMVKERLTASINRGALVIDATVGNGHDTLFLAEAVGDTGTVYGFDIQQQALDNAYERLAQAGLDGRVSLYHAGHEAMMMALPASAHGRVGAVMFNLGYLPGGDKVRTTSINTTLAALEQSRQLLAEGGVISVLAYTGHPGGREEAEAVKEWASCLSRDYYEVAITVPPSKNGTAPEWVWVQRR